MCRLGTGLASLPRWGLPAWRQERARGVVWLPVGTRDVGGRGLTHPEPDWQGEAASI